MIDVAVARVASHAAESDVLGLDGSHLVPRDGALRRPHVDPVEPRRVASEDRRLRRTVCSAERREAVLFRRSCSTWPDLVSPGALSCHKLGHKAGLGKTESEALQVVPRQEAQD